MNGVRQTNFNQIRSAAVVLLAGICSASLLISAEAQGRNPGGSRGDSGSNRSDSGSSRSDSGNSRSDSGSRSESRSSGSSSRDSGSSRSETRSSEGRSPSSGPSRDTGSTRSESRSSESRTSSSSRDTSTPRTYESRSQTPTRDTSVPRQDSRNSETRTSVPARDTSSPRTDSRNTETRTSVPTRDTITTRTDSRSTDNTRSGNGRTGSVTDRSMGRLPSETTLPQRDTTRDSASASNNRRVTNGADGAFHSAPALPGVSTSRSTSSRDINPYPTRSRSYDLFTRSNEGRTFQNGVVLRSSTFYTDRTFVNYFPNSYAYYPHYCSTFDVGISFYSPYSYYGGCAPFIYRRYCDFRPPVSIWIDFPIYESGYSRGYDRYEDDDYYLRRRSYSSDSNEPRDEELERATDDLRDTFRLNNINTLANLVDPAVKVSVFRQGKYEYSLTSNDYLDMTRDMLKSTETVTFDLYKFHRRASGVMVVSGKHIYMDRENRQRTVYVSFVLERISGRWTLTQVGTAPDRINEPR